MKTKQILLAFVLTLVSFNTINAATYSGDFLSNKNIKWELNTQTGNLHIFGKGKMTLKPKEECPWLQYKEQIITCDIDSGVTELCDNAFKGCTKLTSISLPNTLTRLGIRTFAGCVSMDSINIPEKVKMILRNTFDGCSNLKHVNIPKSIKEIRKEAFLNCTSLDKIIIGENVNSIESYAFAGCTKLSSFIVLDSASTEFQDSIFSGCTSLYEIALPQTIKKTSVFTWSNSNIQEVTINITNWANKNYTYLATYKFKHRYTYNGEEICGDYVIPEGITTIGENLLAGCENITALKTSNTTKEILSGAFGNCINISSVELTPSVEKFTDAFKECIGVTTFKIPNTVKSISFEPYNECPNLDYITILIDNWADDNNVAKYYAQYDYLSCGFKFIYKGEEISGDYTFPEGTTKIGNNALGFCNALNSVTLPNSVTIIGDQAFAWCSNLSEVTLSESLRDIGSCAFFRNHALKNINIPSSVTRLGTSAFQQCENLRKITGMEGLKYIEPYTFYGCLSLKEIILPSIMDSIYYGAFSYCKSLSSVKMPDAISYTRYDLFEGCTSLPVIDDIRYADTYLVKALGDNTTYTIKEGTKYICDYAFNCHRNLASIEFPNSIIAIGFDAFSGCNSLQELTIPEGTEIIEPNAFAVCRSLTKLSLPKSIKKMGDCCFYGCAKLQDIDVNWEIPPFPGYDSFGEVDYTTCKLYIPAGTKKSYYGKGGWAIFRNNMIEKNATNSIKDIENESKKKFIVTGNSIETQGLNDNTNFFIYSTNGNLIASGKGNMSVFLAKGTYIIYAEKELQKHFVIK